MAFEENELGQEKTEDPTSKRVDKARQQGSVTQSKEINSAVLLFFALILAATYGKFMMQKILENIKYTFNHYTEFDATSGNIIAFLTDTSFYFVKLIAPFLIVFFVAGIVANLAQFGWLWTTETIFQGFKNFSLNPSKLIGKVFGVSNWVMLGINILKLCVMCIVVYTTLKDEIWTFPNLVQLPLMEGFQYMAKLIFILALKICVLLIIIAAIDYLWQKHKHDKSLKMSKEEIKDEHKQMEGDPKIKARIRSVMQKAAIDRMMKNVPKADVVITNPIHFAIAIKYDRENMAAPMVVAKGARLLAEKIKGLARAASIPIVENKPLAQTLYKTVEVGEVVPPKLYQAVAEVLAYVYQLNEAKKQRAEYV